MSVSPLSAIPPAWLLVIWFVAFALLSDFNCPLFFTHCACANRRK